MAWLFRFRTKDARANLDLNMNNALRNRFPPFLTELSLKSAIESVCAEFGKVTFLKFLPATEAEGSGFHCACFLRLDSADANAKLKASLDVLDFSAEVAFFADVDEKWTGSIRHPAYGVNIRSGIAALSTVTTRLLSDFRLPRPLQQPLRAA